MASDIARHRRSLGAFGERVAAGFLERRGARILARNVRVGRGEIDLVVALGGRRVAVEVKSAIESEIGHPADAFTGHKARQVRALADEMGIPRVDLVTVTVRSRGVDVVWTPFAA